jgi:hypothetical protein
MSHLRETPSLELDTVLVFRYIPIESEGYIMEVNVATTIRRLASLNVNRDIIAKALLVNRRYVDNVLDGQNTASAAASLPPPAPVSR